MAEKILGNPELCTCEECRGCISFEECREIVRQKYDFSYPKNTQFQIEAIKNSLGSLLFEERGYTPD